jgi:hypothetical protein
LKVFSAAEGGKSFYRRCPKELPPPPLIHLCMLVQISAGKLVGVHSRLALDISKLIKFNNHPNWNS